MYSCVVKVNSGKIKPLRKALYNNREERQRPEMSLRSHMPPLVIINPEGRKVFPPHGGAYGRAWAKKYKNGDECAMPTFSELMEGILKWYCAQMESDMADLSESARRKVKKYSNETFSKFLDRAQIPEEDLNKPLIKDEDELDNELNICNPYSKITCLILYMYSCEFGSPPLYCEINRVSRNMDMTYLETLGPFAQCLHDAADQAEYFRQEGDKMPSGYQISDDDESYNMAGLFILWRGVKLRDSWIKDYEDNTMAKISQEEGYEGQPHFIHLPGNISTSQSLAV